MKFYTFYFSVFLIFNLPFNSFTQIKTIQFQQLDSLQTIQERPTIIFIKTDWCKYCAAMKQSTLKNLQIIELINDNYYFIDFNAEITKEISFNGNKYQYNPTGINIGIHELANYLGKINGEISFPTIIILDHKNQIIYKNAGFASAKQMAYILSEIVLKPK